MSIVYRRAHAVRAAAVERGRKISYPHLRAIYSRVCARLCSPFLSRGPLFFRPSKFRGFVRWRIYICARSRSNKRGTRDRKKEQRFPLDTYIYTQRVARPKPHAGDFSATRTHAVYGVKARVLLSLSLSRGGERKILGGQDPTRGLSLLFFFSTRDGGEKRLGIGRSRYCSGCMYIGKIDRCNAVQVDVEMRTKFNSRHACDVRPRARSRESQ